MNRSPGKQVATRPYLHLSAIGRTDAGLSTPIGAAEAQAGLVRGQGYNLIRLDLGRPPEPDEVPPADLAALTETCGTLALMQFECRKHCRRLEPGLQRDIKALFGDLHRR